MARQNEAWVPNQEKSPRQPHPLDAWVLRWAGAAVAYAVSLLHDRHAAEDVVQDCFCRLLAKKDVYDLPQDGHKILFRAVSNACFTQMKQQRHFVPTPRASMEDPWQQVPDDRILKPDQQLLTQELQNAVRGCLAALPPLPRAALELKCLGHSQQEVADCLGISLSHAGVLIYRARQYMARCLHAKGVASPHDSLERMD